jgi:HAD superfamily hydrolase (TIGR01490 family)
MTTLAFFDVDETLISFKSMLSFLDFAQSTDPALALDAAGAAAFREASQRARERGTSRERLNELYYHQFAGAPVAAVAACGERWYKRVRSTLGQRFFNSRVLAALRAHAAQGVEVALLSGSFAGCLAPLVAELDVRCVTFFADLEQRADVYTGKVLEPRSIGAGKAAIARAHAAQRGAELAECYAYADDISDQALLNIVGHPRVIAGCAELESVAASRGWEVWHNPGTSSGNDSLETEG